VGKRATTSDLRRILAKQKFGIKSSIGKIGIGTKIGGARSEHDVESTSGDELEGAKSLQVNYTGKVRVRIKFYRHRLADYDTGSSRAISEKAIIDCLQYSGLIRGDSSKEIWLQDDGQEKVDEKSDERIELVIEYLDVDLDNLWVADGRTDGR
jgi:hypothetical protein